MAATQIRRAFSSFFRLFEINSEHMKLTAKIDERTASGEITREIAGTGIPSFKFCAENSDSLAKFVSTTTPSR